MDLSSQTIDNIKIFYSDAAKEFVLNRIEQMIDDSGEIQKLYSSDKMDGRDILIIIIGVITLPVWLPLAIYLTWILSR